MDSICFVCFLLFVGNDFVCVAARFKIEYKFCLMGESKMRLETRRLLLRPWSEDDAEELYCYAKDPEVGPAAGWAIHTSIENSKEIIKNILSNEKTFAVVFKEKNQVIGCVGIVGEKGQGKEAEIGYWLGKPFWGQGLIPEAVEKLQEYCFEVLNYAGIWCGYFEGNHKSKRVQQKCGFIYHHTECQKQTLLGDKRTEYFTYLSKAQWKNRTK